MYNNIVIIGNKNYKNLDLNKILDFFKNNIRFNFGIPYNNNGTIYDSIVLNNHVYEYSKKSLQEKIDKYCKLFSISETHIEKFHNNLNKFKNIEKQINDLFGLIILPITEKSVFYNHEILKKTAISFFHTNVKMMKDLDIKNKQRFHS